jgi:hypothetical protein
LGRGSEAAEGGPAAGAGLRGSAQESVNQPRVAALDLQLLEHDLKDVGSRFGFLGILGRGRLVDQAGESRDVQIFAELVLLGGGRDGDPYASIARASEQIGDRGKGAHKRQVLGLEPLAAPFLHFLAVVSLFIGPQKR